MKLVWVVELHLIQGTSPVLWIKAIKSYQWNRIKIYTTELMVEKTRRICDKLQQESDFEIDLVITPSLNQSTSLRNFCSEFQGWSESLQPVTNGEVLFYSGTMPQISILVGNIGYESFMKYFKGKFTISGSIEMTIDEPKLDLDDYFTLQGYKLQQIEGKTKISDVNKGIIFVTNRISQISLTEMGKIKIIWTQIETSGQRKRLVNNIRELIELFGSSTIEHEVNDYVVEMWLKNINTPFQFWGEEE